MVWQTFKLKIGSPSESVPHRLVNERLTPGSQQQTCVAAFPTLAIGVRLDPPLRHKMTVPWRSWPLSDPNRLRSVRASCGRPGAGAPCRFKLTAGWAADSVADPDETAIL